jgi:hypothetical protein
MLSRQKLYSTKIQKFFGFKKQPVEVTRVFPNREKVKSSSTPGDFFL